MSDELLRIDGSITLSWQGSQVSIECKDSATAEGIFSVLKSSMELGIPVEFAWTGQVVEERNVSDDIARTFKEYSKEIAEIIAKAIREDYQS